MRVIAGKHKGRRIISKPSKTLRPTSSSTRETIFNLLKHGKFRNINSFISDGKDPIEGRSVIDIFCGTGAMGFEALSRGASYLTLVDKDRKNLSMAKETATNFKEQEQMDFIISDSTYLPKAFKKHQLAFIDPPYGKNIGLPALESLRDNNWLDNGAVVVLEHEKSSIISPPDGFNQIDERNHGNTKITLYQYIA